MNYKKAFLLLNGKAPNKLPNLNSYDFICVTDGAYNHLLNLNIKPNLVCGDFDSITEIPKNITTIHTPNQNFTDFDKALQLIKNKGFKAVDIYGASGKEPDHFLGNIHTALQYKNNLNLTFFDNYGSYFFIENYFKTKNVLGKTVSLIPFFEAKNITTKGLQYSLKKEDLTFGKRIGTRNKATKDEIEISFSEGNLLVYISY